MPQDIESVQNSDSASNPLIFKVLDRFLDTEGLVASSDSQYVNALSLCVVLNYRSERAMELLNDYLTGFLESPSNYTAVVTAVKAVLKLDSEEGSPSAQNILALLASLKDETE